MPPIWDTDCRRTRQLDWLKAFADTSKTYKMGARTERLLAQDDRLIETEPAFLVNILKYYPPYRLSI